MTPDSREWIALNDPYAPFLAMVSSAVITGYFRPCPAALVQRWANHSGRRYNGGLLASCQAHTVDHMKKPLDLWVSVAAAAKVAKVTRPTVYAWAATKRRPDGRPFRSKVVASRLVIRREDCKAT